MLGCSALSVCLVLLSAPADPGKQKTAPQQPARRDQHGDPLPEGAIARIGTVRLRHAGPVSALAYSHDGKILASGSEDGTIRLWDAVTGKELQCLARQQGKVAQIHFSADGRRLIAWSDWQGYFSRVRVWDLRTGKAIGASGGLARHPEAIAVSYDGTHVATVEGNTPRQHYWASGPEERSKEEDPPRNLEVWDTRTGKRLLRLKVKDRDTVEGLSLSPDGKWLAASQGRITVWETASGKECSSFVGDRFPRVIAFTHDGKALAVLEWSQIRFWNPATGEEGKPKAFPDKHDYDIPLPPWDRGLFRRARGGGLIRIDDFTDCKRRCQFRDPDGREHVFAFSLDGKRLATGGKDHCIRIRDAASGKEVLPFIAPHGTLFLMPCHDPRQTPLLSYPGCSNLLSDGKTLAVSVAGAIVRFDASTGRELRRDKLPRAENTDWPPFHPRPEVYALTPDGKQAVVSDGRDVLLLDLTSGKRRRVFDEQDNSSLIAADFSPDGTRVGLRSLPIVLGGLVTPTPECRLVDARTGKKIPTFDGHLSFGDSTLFSPDGRWLAVRGSHKDGHQKKGWVVDLATGKTVSQPLREAVHGTNSALSPNGSLLANWPDPVIAPPSWAKGLSEEEPLPPPEVQRIKVWELTTGTLVAELPDPGCTTTSVAIAGNGWLLAAGRLNGDIVLWNLATGKEIRRLRGHRGSVNTLSFSGDGRLLVSGSSDVTVLTWDVSDLAASGLSPSAKLTPAKRDAFWAGLAVPDAAKAYPFLWQLVGDDKVVPFFRERLRPVGAVPEQRVARLIADLQEKQFAVRSRAFKELDRLDHLAEPALRKALAGRPSLEARRRMELLLEEWQEPTRSPERLRALRALLVLESIGSAEAMQLLRELAGGVPEAWFTQQARASLERLGRLRNAKP